MSETEPIAAPVAAERQTYGNFAVIRVLAAVAVILHHSFTLTGHDVWVIHSFQRFRFDFGSLGVGAFFTISGFLITESWYREPRVTPYATRRVARIWPAFVVVIVVVAFVVGPIVTTADLSTYLRSWRTRGYITNNVFFFPLNRQTLMGVFTTNPFPNITNGSLWSLPYEVAAYIGVLAVGVAKLPRKWTYAALAAAGLIGTTLIDRGIWEPAARFGPFSVRPAMELIAWFAMGACLSIWSRWTLQRALAIAFAVGLVGLAVDIAALAIPAVALALVAIGIRSSRFASAVTRSGDPTYGTYLFAWPIQQTLMWAGLPRSSALLFVTATVLSVAGGYASWYLVERPCNERARTWLRSRAGLSAPPGRPRVGREGASEEGRRSRRP